MKIIKSVRINQFLKVNVNVLEKNSDYPKLKLHKIWKQLGNHLLIEYDMIFPKDHIYQISVNSKPNIDIINIQKFVNDWNHNKYKTIWMKSRQQVIEHEVKVNEAKIETLKNKIKELK